MLTASTPGAPELARTFSHAWKTRRFSMSNDFRLVGFDPSIGSSPAGLASSRSGPPGPFTPAPLQGLHRYYGPVCPCAPHRYSPPPGDIPLAFSLSTTRGPTTPISTGRHYRDDRFSCSMPAPATSSRHFYTGHRQDSHQAASWPCSRALCDSPVSMSSFAVSMRQQWFTLVRLHRRTPDPSHRAFSATLTTTALNRSSLRWFGTSA